MKLQIFNMLELINNKISNLEKNLAKIDEKIDYSIMLQRNHLIRIKNDHEIDDAMILQGRPYNDLSPQRAFQIYKNNDLDFLVLDVSRAESNARLEGSVNIPLEELDYRYTEIVSQTIPILIISEKGVRSIQACELLVKKGFFNLNNVSGGHEFWPGSRKETSFSSLDKE